MDGGKVDSLMKVVVVLLLFCVSSGAETVDEETLIGGRIVNVLEIPYQVSVVSEGEHKYGGVIISNNAILTAAHFMSKNLPNFHVRTGVTLRNVDGTLHRVTRTRIHPKYNPKTFEYDFAILQLNYTMKFDRTHMPIKLPKMNEEVKNNRTCQVSGWGSTLHCRTNMFLRVENLTKSTQDEQCRDTPEMGYSNEKICAALPNGSSRCFIDPGAPLTCNGILEGVASKGQCCNSSGFPTLYGSVSRIIEWIDATIRELK